MANVDRVWYLRREGEKASIGPFSTEALLSRWQKGEIDRSSVAWREGMLDWRPLLELEPFASAARVSLDVSGVIRFHCECGNEIVMAERFAGRLAKCSICSRPVTVPDPYAPVEPTPASKPPSRRKLWPYAAGGGTILAIAAIAGFVFPGWLRSDPAATGGAPNSHTGVAGGDDTGSAIAADSGDRNPRRPRRRTRADGTDGSPASPRQRKASGDTQAGNDAPKTAQENPGDKSSEEEGPSPAQVRAAARANEKAKKAIGYLVLELAAVLRTEKPTTLERLAELLADECVVISPDGTRIKGKSSVLKHYSDTVEQYRKRYRTMVVNFRIQTCEVDGDRAMVEGTVTEHARATSGGTAPRHDLLQMIILARQDGEWKLTRIQSTRSKRKSVGAG